MLSLHVNGTPLKLRAGTEVNVEHINPLFADGIEDSYSLPMEVPTDGNEPALGHVHELSLAERELTLDNAELHHGGQRLHPGELVVLASTKDTVRMSFSIDAFVAAIKGLMLPDLLREELLDRTTEEGDGITMHSRPRYSEGGNCQFPMFLNRAQYGDERPTWNPSASSWDATRTYSQNDLVEYTTRDRIERTWVYQCTDGAGTAAGESPETHPAKWRRTAFGLVNAWDAAEGEHYRNTESANWYTWVPWFYVKWVMARALANLGFRVEGSWMEDETSHELLLPNTTTIDSESLDTGEGSAYYFRADQTGSVVLATGSTMRLPANAETPLPSQDPDGVWDSSANVWTVPAAGSYRLRASTTLNRYPSPTYGATPKVRYLLYDVAFGSSPVGIVAVVDRPMVVPWNLNTEVTFDVSFGAGDVGRQLAILLQVVEINTGTTVLWPRPELGDGVTNTVVTGWVLDYDPGSANPDRYIWPHRHVPNVELGSFLVAWCDAYNLRFTADMQNKVVRLDLREALLKDAEAHTTDESERLLGTPELDHERSTTGMRLAWDVEENNAADPELQPTLEFYSEEDLVAPATTGQVAVIKSTRKLLRSAFKDGEFVWRQTGYHVPEVLQGDEQEATEVVPAVRPLHMEQVWLDGEEYLVPVMDEQGTSAFYHGKGEQNVIYACHYWKGKSADGSVTEVPSALTWGYAWDEESRASATLQWDANDAVMPGLYQRHWQSWVAMLLAAEPVTADLAVDLPFLLSKRWQGFMHLRGHRYLCERLPVNYRTDRAELVSQGAYLLKLKPYHPQPLRTPFACVGPGYGSFVVKPGFHELTGLLALASSSLHYTTRKPDGTTSTAAVLDFMYAQEGGTYCLWASDENGTKDGALLDIQLEGAITEADLRGISDLQVLSATFCPEIQSLNTEGLSQLWCIHAQNCALTADAVDSIFLNVNEALPFVDIRLDGGTSAAPTAASLAKRTLLASLGHNIVHN